MALIADFFRALGQAFDGRFLGVLLKAIALTLALLLGLTVLTGWLASFIPTDWGEWPLIGQVTLPIEAFQGLAVGAVLFASSFLMIPVAALFVGFFLDEVADAVEAKHYPNLPEPRRGTFLQDIGAALRFFLAVVGVNLLALIPYLIFLFLIPPLAIALVFGINGYLLGREYFELLAARHIPVREAETLRRRNWGKVWFAGILMALPLTIPIMNLIVPVLGVATITHQYHRLRDRSAAAET
ncbi:MAG: EI24 domain-containing protein [Pseudomonadota bacterium]